MQAARITCQMRPAPAGVPSHRGTTPQGLPPLLKPLGSTAQQSHKFGARLFYAASTQSNAPNGFVRPDVPPDSTDEPARRAAPTSPDSAAGGFQRWDGASSSSDGGADGGNKASFRSALEQASWMTATEQAGRADGRRSGKFGLGFFGL